MSWATAHKTMRVMAALLTTCHDVFAFQSVSIITKEHRIAAHNLPLPMRYPLSGSLYSSVWEEDFLYDETNDDDDKISETESDWVQAELTIRQAPTEPSPDLSPETVALTCCRSLQWVDYPTESAGLARCFPFFTFECRKAVTARQGGNTVERFQQYGVLSPALQPFMGAHRIDFGEGTYTGAHPPMRGAMVSFAVEIQVAPVLAVQHPSGMERKGVVATPAAVHMVLRLEQQRRPPNQGCWLVREVLDVRHAFAGDMGNAHVGG
eukprot:scaffold3240_cov187-Amphora_coffeaeformis.AAC.22